MLETAVAESLYRGGRLRRSIVRLGAHLEFALQRRERRSVLGADQVRRFLEEGYLLVPGLVPDDISRRAAAAMWHQAGASEDAPGTWNRLARSLMPTRDPDLLACYTPAYLAAAAQVAGDDVATIHRPRETYWLNVLPREPPWRHGMPHIDHANEGGRHRTFTRAFRVATIVFLSDVDPQGGGTVLWPGSHRRIQELARSDRRRYRFRKALNSELPHLDLGSSAVLAPRRGDVLFWHCFCAHAYSTNVAAHPRLAVRMVW